MIKSIYIISTYLSAISNKFMKTLNVIFINIAVFATILFLVYMTFNMKECIITNIEINSSDNKYPRQIYKDDITILQNDINRIDEINNKRFEMLGWGVGIVISTIALLLIISYVNSKATMRDMVYEELSLKNKDFQKKYNELLTEIRSKKDELNSEVDKVLSDIRKS